MAFPRNPATNRRQSLDFPSRPFETGSAACELCEEDDEFVLSVEMRGSDPEEIDLAWDDGSLIVAAGHNDGQRDRRKAYHRRFRFPKLDEVEASEEDDEKPRVEGMAEPV